MSVVDSLKRSVEVDEKKRLALKCALAKEVLAVKEKFRSKDSLLKKEIRDLGKAIKLLSKSEVVKNGKI